VFIVPEALPRALSNQKSFHLARAHVTSILISFYVCAWIVVGFVAASDRFLHWFVIPVLLCGVLIGSDAVEFFRGRLNVFDPVGILGLLGLHFFFLAPLLHVQWDYWMAYVISPPDWRDWLGGMACLNVLGLLAYRVSRNTVLRHRQKQSTQTVWRLDRQRFFIIVSLALLITGGLQIWVYAQYGGVLGYVRSYTERFTSGPVFRGMGWIFMISESFPILAMMLFTVCAKRKRFSKSWAILALALFAFFILKMLFGGLRGSRSNTIWGLFWAVGIVHFWMRPIAKKFIFVGCILLVLFMYLYGFYKGAGLDALRAFESAEARAELTLETGRSLEVAVLADLGRSDVQAFLLHRLSTPGSDYEYAWGRTYLGAAAILIPRAVWPNRPPDKVKEGTEVQYGMGSYIPGIWVSSRVYGLAGEATLNFGPIAVPFAYLILGFIVGRVSHFVTALEPADSRLILLPFLVNLCFVILVSDSDNVLFFLIKNGAVPFAVLALSSAKLVLKNQTRRPRHAKSPASNNPPD
jgi:hypothetical protein